MYDIANYHQLYVDESVTASLAIISVSASSLTAIDFMSVPDTDFFKSLSITEIFYTPPAFFDSSEIVGLFQTFLHSSPNKSASISLYGL